MNFAQIVVYRSPWEKWVYESAADEIGITGGLALIVGLIMLGIFVAWVNDRRTARYLGRK